MALINRISRLFTADLHAVLDRIEEPEALLKQALREMEEELIKGEQRVKFLGVEADQLRDRQERIEGSVGELDEKLDLCFASGKDDLARTQVKRKLEAQRLIKVLTQRRAGVERVLAEQRAALDENRARLDGLRQKAEALSAEALARPGPTDADWNCGAFPVSAEEVEVAFLHEAQRRKKS